ncbi:MAG TPA: hypothetical protein VGZ52_08995 [Acidimicrobiales bacterium]|nr:hypothetical protein [Acidimicrobiales bacterium]
MVIGLVLLAAAAVVGIDVVVQNNFAIDVVGFGKDISTSLAGLFVAGVVTGLVAAVGIMLVRDGTIHWRKLRREARADEAERDRLVAIALRQEEERNVRGASAPLDLREQREPRPVQTSAPDHASTF